MAWAIFTAYLAYHWWGPWLRLQSALLADQRRCASYSEPKDHVVLDSDRQRARLLTTAAGYAQSELSPSTAVSRAADGVWGFLETARRNRLVLERERNPDVTDDNFELRDGSDFFPSHIVFMHRLFVAGHERLVVVRAVGEPGDASTGSPNVLGLSDPKDVERSDKAVTAASRATRRNARETIIHLTLNGVAAASALLCLTTAAGWVLSYSHPGSGWAAFGLRPRVDYSLSTSPGQIILEATEPEFREPGEPPPPAPETEKWSPWLRTGHGRREDVAGLPPPI